uniref:8 kDa protein n=1 Tax=Yam virus 1 TaxID=3123105 RepID=A0AAU6NEI9_9CLOS
MLKLYILLLLSRLVFHLYCKNPFLFCFTLSFIYFQYRECILFRMILYVYVYFSWCILFVLNEIICILI